MSIWLTFCTFPLVSCEPENKDEEVSSVVDDFLIADNF